MDFRFDYSIEDILRRYEPSPEGMERLARMQPLPQIARIPEGAEEIAAERLAGLKHFRAATPDFLVRPQSAATINSANIERAVAAICSTPRCDVEGEAATAAILDSGIDTTLVPGANIHPIQFDVSRPHDRGSPPSDSLGHGSVVAYIVNRVAPAARIISIKGLAHSGSMSDVLAGM